MNYQALYLSLPRGFVVREGYGLSTLGRELHLEGVDHSGRSVFRLCLPSGLRPSIVQQLRLGEQRAFEYRLELCFPDESREL